MASVALTFGCDDQPTEVVLCSTIHGAHEVNPNYTYEDLYAFIEAYDPDVIGVEIRAEDMDSSTTYLGRNYPYEMFACLERYPDKEIVGIDWLGEGLIGRAIPPNYWHEESEIRKLQQQLFSDSTAQSKLAITDSIRRHKEAIALTASLKELNDGRYDSLNERYYAALERQFESTPYQELTDFYAQRDRMIAENIVQTIKQHRGKKLLFLVGADHRSNALRTVKEAFGDDILLNRPLEE